MALSSAQLTSIKNAIIADGTLNTQPADGNGLGFIRDAMNAVASPDFWVWRTSVSREELTNVTSVDGTTFNWTGTGYITRAQGERDAFDQIFSAAGTVNPALPQVRQAFTDIFSGATAPAPANRTHLNTIARRKATRLEKLLATGTGSTVSPAIMAFEGAVTANDIDTARRS